MKVTNTDHGHCWDPVVAAGSVRRPIFSFIILATSGAPPEAFGAGVDGSGGRGRERRRRANQSAKQHGRDQLYGTPRARRGPAGGSS